MATTIGSLDLNAFSDLYSDSTQYFWFESNSSATYGAGAHVTLVPDTSFISNPTGQNILMNTDGFSIRNGLLPMMTLDNDSLDFNVVNTTAGTYVTTATFTSTGAQIGQSSGTHLELNTNGFSILNGSLPMMTLDNGSLGFNVVDTTAGTSTTTATFTATGAQIGQSSSAHSVIDANGQRFYASDGTTQLANIGYGEGTDSSGGEDNAPYYTLGFRNTITPTVGNYSVVEGNWCTASAYCSHAEGSLCYATGYCSHAEGNNTISRGDCSHAEGELTTARGLRSHAEGGNTTASALCSHAEGSRTIAQGIYSHVQNLFTVATEDSQTVIGKYNAATVTGSGTEADPYVYSDVGDYAFIIGNGTDNPTANRSNALTVDWNGNVDLPTGKFSGVGATLTYDASNSGTNALEINNASSNALTVDWAGNVEAAGDIYPQNTLMADFVVEQGTSGNWTYTKWNSGKCEQWYVGNPGSYTVGTTRGQLRSGSYLNYTYPVAFTAAPSVTVNATLTTDTYVVWAQASNHSNTGISVRIVASANIAANSSYIIHIHAVGTWK